MPPVYSLSRPVLRELLYKSVPQVVQQWGGEELQWTVFPEPEVHHKESDPQIRGNFSFCPEEYHSAHLYLLHGLEPDYLVKPA
jgi:hypothetical protein